MTRQIVAYEGKPTRDGWVIKPGALRVENDRIPVTIGFDHSYPIGYAENFERDEETGAITFDIVTKSLTAGMSPSISIKDVVGESYKEQFVNGGVICEVSFVDGMPIWAPTSRDLHGS